MISQFFIDVQEKQSKGGIDTNPNLFIFLLKPFKKSNDN